MERPKLNLNKNDRLLNSNLKENQIRHSFNLSIFTGFYHGLFYIAGRCYSKRPKEKSSKIKP